MIKKTGIVVNDPINDKNRNNNEEEMFVTGCHVNESIKCRVETVSLISSKYRRVISPK